MSDTAQVHRSVTRLGGTELRPLHLLSQQGANSDHVGEADGTAKKTLKRRFPVNDNKLSWEPRAKQSKNSTTCNSAKLGTVQKAQYYEFLVLNQAGKACTAHDNSTECKLVAIKKRNLNGTADYDCRQEIQDENVMNLIEIFIKDEQVYLVYEQMDVSLDIINGIPRGRWQAFEIAAICKEILNSLSFIHNELRMYHGAIEYGSIIFSRDGQIKLGK
ncbi:MAG: hypothetical protein L6R42_000103 [Xanthoria sp. 1 TBL-2021]|nr:MAG: hypothetical protein L6R42_000103 [Xanthoria sp. 1 TBL-2021]